MSRTKRPPTYSGKKRLSQLPQYKTKAALPQTQKCAQNPDLTRPSPPSLPPHQALKRKAKEEPEPIAPTSKPTKRVKIAPVAKISPDNPTAKCSEEPLRKEDEVRSKRLYKSRSGQYVPGRWASPEGYKKLNTSHYLTSEAAWEQLVRRRNLFEPLETGQYVQV